MRREQQAGEPAGPPVVVGLQGQGALAGVHRTRVKRQLSHNGTFCHEPGRRDSRDQWATRARTRQGLPEPLTIGSGAAITMAPVTGSLSTLRSWVRPYLPAPRRNWWQGKAGSKPWAAPASVPTVSTPRPRMAVSDR